MAPTGKPLHCILSKADKLNRNEQANALRMAHTVLSSYVDEDGKPFPFTAQLFSALKRTGLEEADTRILALTGLDVALSDSAECNSSDILDGPDAPPAGA